MWRLRLHVGVEMRKAIRWISSTTVVAAAGLGAFQLRADVKSGATLTGSAAFTDYLKQSPGIIRKITPADLPKPFATPSASNNARVVPRPDGAWPKAMDGFKVDLYASLEEEPREI